MRRLAVLVALIPLALSAAAEPILQPDGLKLGDQYRLLFTTSTKRDATSTDIKDYNAFVQATADAAPVVGTWGLEWKAVASTEAVTARENTSTDWGVGPGVPIFRVDGTLFSDGNVGLWSTPETNTRGDSSFAAPGINEFGVPIEIEPFARGLFVWTGSNNGDELSPPDAPPLGSISAALGEASTTSIRAIHWGSGAETTEEHHFYALSEIITVVPEPGNSWWCVYVILGASARRRRLRSSESL